MAACYILLCITTGGLILYAGYRFEGGSTKGAGECFPLVYADWKKTEIPILPIAFHLIYYSPRTDLIVDQLEFKQGKAYVDPGDKLDALHKEYSSITINALRIVYLDQTEVDIIDSTIPEAERTFKTIEPWNEHVKIYKDIIKKRQSFKIIMEGYATKKSGEKEQFSTTSKEELTGIWQLWTRYGEWAGV